jgi:hypothetical protein
VTAKIWSVLAVVVAVALSTAAAAWWVTNTHWQKKWAARDLADSQAQTTAQVETRKTETASAIAVSAIDQQQYTELQNAQKTISALRADVAAGTRRLQQCQGADSHSETTIGQSTGVGDGQRADSTASGSEIEQTILDIGEDAVTAIKQRDACVAAYQQNQHIIQQ